MFQASETAKLTNIISIRIKQGQNIIYVYIYITGLEDDLVSNSGIVNHQALT